MLCSSPLGASGDSRTERDQEIETALLNCDVRNLLLATRAFEFLVFGNNLSLVATIVVVGEFEKDQPNTGVE